jgi:predicted nucleic acid-binding protein
MAYKHLFIDSDVILDMLVDRQPFSIYAEMLIVEKQQRGIRLSTSTLVIANVHYILTKLVKKQAAKEGVSQLLKLIDILPFELDAIENAVSGSFSDFEDAIENHIAIKANCDAIITRNIKDYKQATIPVLTAEQFLRQL